jgi:peptidoglycan/xylan/chitin deacetylase (PgdA/CDA1 family)
MKYALFTCDTEFTPPWNIGTWRERDPWTFEVGIKEITSLLAKFGIRGTFFCEGTVAERYPSVVAEMAKDHLIGCHGYNHENYGGRPVHVWSESKPVFIEDKNEKRQLLIKAKKAIRKAIGKDPEVFVAPFDSIDITLLKILEELEFKVDCSYYNYSHGLPTLFFMPEGVNILELPLTVIYCNEMKYKNVIEAFTYDR